MKFPIRHWHLFALLLGILACGLVPVGRAQVEMSTQGAGALGSLYLDAIVFRGTALGESRVDVFLQVGYDALSFVKEGEVYSSGFEVTLTVRDSAGALINEKTWTEEVKGITFEQSVSAGAFALTQRTLTVPPGRYQIAATVVDRESKKSRKVETPLLVSDFRSDFSMSDLMLLSKVTQQGDRRSVLPNISGNVGEIADPFPLYVELYNRREIDTTRIVITILDSKEEKSLEQDTLVALRDGKNERILYVPHGALALGDYRIFLRAYPGTGPPQSDTSFIASTNRPFIVRWRGMPRGVKDLDLAIEQVRYIAKDDEFSQLSDAKTPEEKQEKFLEFWKRRDPNPNTPRNERMENYFARVEYANRHFSHYREGWRTDMGMIYIIFGPPNNVERHPFDSDSKPYEVWSYYDISYSFVFLDETGFGDYRLATPLWEVYNRARR